MAWFVKRGQIQRCQLRREKNPSCTVFICCADAWQRKGLQSLGPPCPYPHSAPLFLPPPRPCLSFCIYLPPTPYCMCLSPSSFLLFSLSPLDSHPSSLQPTGWPSSHCHLPIPCLCLPSYVPESPVPGSPPLNFWLLWPSSFWTGLVHDLSFTKHILESEC